VRDDLGRMRVSVLLGLGFRSFENGDLVKEDTDGRLFPTVLGFRSAFSCAAHKGQVLQIE
jgi:hypothetical protein